MDEPICVPAKEEHPLPLETTCVFIEHKGEEVAPLLDVLDMLHCLNFQLFDAKLLCLSEEKATLIQEIIHQSVRSTFMVEFVHHTLGFQWWSLMLDQYVVGPMFHTCLCITSNSP